MVDIIYIGIYVVMVFGIYDVCERISKLVKSINELNKNILGMKGFVYNTDTKPSRTKHSTEDKDPHDFIPNVNISNME